MKTLLFIGFVVFIIAVILQFAHSKPRTWGVVQIKSGSLGSGKTYLSVSELVSNYKRLSRKAVKKDVRNEEV